MRCKACNATMAVQFTKRGNMEDLCSRCRTYVYYDLTRENDDSQVSVAMLDVESIQEDSVVYDRNHENLGFLDEIE